MKTFLRGAAIAIVAAGALGMQPGGAAEVTLKAGTFLPTNDAQWYPSIKMFLDRVNDKGSAQQLKINMVAAGPAAMSPFEMGNAVKGGVLDLAHVPGAYYNSLVPAVDSQKLATLPVAELRRNGAFDLFRTLHAEKMNVHFLGLWGDEVPFHFYLTKKIDKPDLSGMKIRGSPIYQALIVALGGSMITTPPGEAYTAIERGIVDGYGWPLWGIEAWGWQKLTKYRVEPGFYRAEVSVLVHLPTWRKLTPQQQEVLNEAQLHLEREFEKTRAANNAAALKVQNEAGIQPIRFTGAERDKFLKTAEDAGWAEAIRKDPVNGPKLRELLTRR
jgi:TRAP-type C4-dicarboxylate transport system substrate-binding protein